MIKELALKEMLSNAINIGMNYNAYREIVDDLLAEGKSTGNLQNEDMLNYSNLSVRRMKRWEKTFKLKDEDKNFLTNFNKSLTFLVITEGWCGDAAHALPIIHKMEEVSGQIDLKIVLRDENDDLIQQFLTNGGKSIPKLIALDGNLEVLFTWGPRPTEATALVNDYKTEHGALTPEFKEDLQRWYNKDKGRNIVEDLKSELKAL